MKKQPYIAAVQYRRGIEIFKHDLDANEAAALRRYFFKMQMAGEVGMYTVIPLNLVGPPPDESLGVAVRQPIPVLDGGALEAVAA